MQAIKSLLDSLELDAFSSHRMRRLVISIFVLVVIFAIIDFSLFIGRTEAVFVDQVTSGIAEFITGTWTTENCTYTIGYWANHPDDWPVEGITLGKILYSKAEAIEVLQTPPRGDATYLLAHQLVAAKLNVLNGADGSVVEAAINNADNWLVGHELGSNPVHPDRESGIDLADFLELFNSGVVGPGSCSGDGRFLGGLSIERKIDRIIPDIPEPIPPLTETADSENGSVAVDTPLPPATEAAHESVFPSPTTTPILEGETTQTSPTSKTPRPTPTLAPTMDPIAVNHEPTETSRPTPTSAPTQVPPEPTTPAHPTPTLAPTQYSGPPGCTQPFEYWMSNQDSWPLDQFHLGGEEYDLASAVTVLEMDPQGDVTYLLARQYISALMNIASPADPSSILHTVTEAETWFYEHPLGSDPKKQARKESLKLVDFLESYNLGIVGPGSCEALLPSPTPTATSTPTGEPTPTMAPTVSLQPPSPTPAVSDPTPTPTVEISPEPTPTPVR